MRERLLPAAVVLACLGSGAALPGCVLAEAIAGALGGGEDAEAPVVQRYFGLDGKRVGVVAAIDPRLAREQPELGAALETLLADRFARHVPAAGVLPPAEVAAWRLKHPWWESVPPGRVTDGLGVERLVRVEVSAFRTNRSGNANVLDGLLDTAVQVYELDGRAGPAGAADPDRPVFLDRVRVSFPDDSELGIPVLGDSGDPGPNGIATPGGPDAAAVVQQLLATWIRRAGPLFYDQDEARKRDERRAKERADAVSLPAMREASA